MTNHEMPYIKCGVCSTEFRGYDEAENREAFADHSCTQTIPSSWGWLAGIFSFEGIVVVFIICAMVVSLVTGVPW